MKGKLPVKIMDVLIIVLAAGLTGFSAFSAYINPKSTSQVMIEGPNDRWVFPLDAEETVSVKGALGDTVIKIHGNEVWVDSSPCDNQTCVAMGHVHSNGDWVACLPNNVYFMIEGSDGLNNYPDRTSW